MTAIILKNGNHFEPQLTDITLWQQHFPGINIDRELGKIAAWNHANPLRRKTERGIRRHIASWLSNCTPDTSTRNRTLEQDLSDRSWAR